MTSSEPYLGNDYLHVGDGKGLVISNIAHSKIHSPKRTFTLSNILHVPAIKKPLLSVQKFCLENNVFFEFHSCLFYIKDLMTKEVLLSGQSKDGLYVLSESSAMSLPQAFSSTCLSTSADIWHRRLGHPSPCILHLLVNNKKVSCTTKCFNFNCPASPLGKSCRLTLKTTGHQTLAPLDLIFSDVWGPSPMLSSDGFRYFVIFVDAHTKFIWFYPMVAKSDVFNIFHQFQALVERQFSLKIKSVQKDWGGEYRKLNTYFKTIGIHHRVICPHTHEQNGMVERRHRHIVETGLTLLGQCHAPLKYWSYAFESSVYLINRMPTPVLNYKSPFECLLKSSPDYAFLRTFGCLCFPFLRPYNTHKLDFRSSACVFLGYSNSHLGYRCLDLTSKRIYLARHVQFHEHVFPLGKSEQIAVPPTNPTTATIPVTLYHPKPPSSALPPLPPSPPTSHLAPLPLSACYYHDHAVGTGSDSPPSHAVQVQIAPANSPGSSPAGSPVLAVTPADSTAGSTPRPAHILSSSSGSSSDSSDRINLCVDSSKFQLKQIPASVDTNSSQPARLHPMVLRPRPPKDVIFSVATPSRVATLPQ
jgi:histone deacetylase 1/2